MLAANSSTSNTLSWGQTLAVLIVAASTILLTGIIVIIGRRVGSKEAMPSVVRSWIALALVAGLVLFGATAFAINDTNLRSTLIGGLTASVGAAVAFYFSSKTSDQARQDILSAAFGTEKVPDVTGRTEADAAAQLGKTSLKLVVEGAGAEDPNAVVVKSQDPPIGSEVRKGSTVVVTVEARTDGGPGSAGQGYVGQGSAGEGSAGQESAGQESAGQGSAGQDSTAEGIG